MKKIFLISSLLFLSFFLSAQSSQDLKLNFKIVDKKKLDFAFGKIILIDVQTNDSLKARLNNEGKTHFYIDKSHSYKLFIQNKLHDFNLQLNEKNECDVKITIGSEIQKPSQQEDTVFQNLAQKQKSTKNEQLVKFQVVDPQNVSVPFITIQLLDKQTNMRFISNSDESGLIRFLLPEGDYQMIADGNIDYPIVKVKIKSGMVLTDFITLRSTPIVEKKTNDTIEQSFPLRVIPTYARTMITVRISDRLDKYLSNEFVYMNVDSSNIVYKGSTDMTGVVNFLVPKGHVYYVHTSYERNLEAIEVIKTIEKEWIELNYSYYVSELLKKQAESKASGGAWGGGSSFSDKKPSEKDSIVYWKLNQMKNIDKKLIVTDLTGSMYPYISQLLAWYKITYSLTNKADLIFFNDGDSKLDSKKKIGATGGIYPCYQCVYDSCIKTMERTANNGGGGDCPENNLEAILYALKNVKRFDALIMIADNYATPRDMELLRKIKFPIKIILCGATENNLNVDYLKIARETNGEVYTMDQDLLHLNQILEGETVGFGDKIYKIKNGDFIFNKNKHPKCSRRIWDVK